MYFDYNEKKQCYYTWERDENTPETLRKATAYKLGYFLTCFLNTDFEHLKLITFYSSNNCTYACPVNEYNEKDYVLNLITEELIKKSIEFKKDLTSGMIQTMKTYQAEISHIIHTNSFDNVELLEYSTNINIIFKRYSDCDEYYLEYEVHDIHSLLLFEIAKLTNNNVKIKRCANCGKYFIPTNRSDEIYCDNIFRSGKTCKQIGYEEKEKKDPFKSLYTKARKTQHARIQYNKENKPNYKEEHYIPWKEAAEKARDHYRAINDFEGFKKWIDDNKNSF